MRSPRPFLVSTMVAALAATAPVAAHAEPAVYDEAIKMSVDSTDSYASELSVPVIMSVHGTAQNPNAPAVVVPGDTLSGDLTVLNDGPTDGVLRAYIVDVEGSGPGGIADDLWFADAENGVRVSAGTGTGSVLRFHEDGAQDLVDLPDGRKGVPILTAGLGKGAATDISVNVDFPREATSGNRAGWNAAPGGVPNDYAPGKREASFRIFLQIEGVLDPTASPDAAYTPHNTPVTVTPLDNDLIAQDEVPWEKVELLDPEGEPVTELTVPEGTFVVNDDNTVTFTPVDGFEGPVPSVPYRATDESGRTADSTITITVGPAPVVVENPDVDPDVRYTPYETPVTLNPLDNDETPAEDGWERWELLDQFGEPIEGSELVVPEGTFRVNDDGTLTFFPREGFTGEVPAVSYRATDADGNSAESTVTIIVGPPTADEGPSAEPDIEYTPHDTPVTVDVRENDETPSGGWVSTELIDEEGNPLTELTVPEGTFTVEDDGTVTFTPTPGFEGPVPPVTYRVTDDDGGTAESTVTIIVGPPIVTEAPDADPDREYTPYETPVTLSPLDNDTTPAEGGWDKVELLDEGGNPTTELAVPEGTFVVNEDLTVTFTPAPGFEGPVPSVPYRATDIDGGTAESTITILVGPPVVEQGPDADPDYGYTEHNTPITLTPLDNDSTPAGQWTDLHLLDLDGNPVKELTVPEGTFVVNDDLTVTFTPSSGFMGPVPPVPYRVTDVDGGTAESTITIIVGPPSAEPPAPAPAPGKPLAPPSPGDTGYPTHPGDAPRQPSAQQPLSPVTGFIAKTGGAAVDALGVPAIALGLLVLLATGAAHVLTRTRKGGAQ